MKNKLYETCEGFLGKNITEEDSQIHIKFGINFAVGKDEVRNLRRQDVNNLYFNIVESVITREMAEDLYDLRSYIRSVDNIGDGYYEEKIENIIDAIYNGNEYKRK